MELRTDRRGFLRLSGSVFAVSLVPSVTAASGGWRKPRGDAANTAAAATGPQDGVTSDWSTDVDVVGTPVVADGSVYAATAGGVRAFDVSGGDELWRYDADGAVDAPVSYTDGSVYFVAGSVVYALDASDGTERWSRRGTGASASPAVAVDENVYVGVSSTLYALGVHTGTVLWEESLSRPLAGAPAVRDGTVYAATDDGNLYAFETDGGVEWTADAGASVVGAPVPTPEGVFVVGGRGGVRSVTTDGDDGWSESLNAPVSEPPAVGSGYVYVATDDGTVHALRTSSGWEDWIFETEGEAVHAPVVGGDTVYVVADGTVYALEASDGNELWRHDGVSGSPAVLGSDLVFGDGSLRRLTGTVGVPDTDAVSASVENDTVEVGGSVNVTAEIRNTGGADGTHQAAVYVDAEAVGFYDVDVPAGETVETTFTVDFDDSGERSVSVDGVEAGTVEAVGASEPTEETGAETNDRGDGTEDNRSQNGTGNDGDSQNSGEGLPGFGVPAAVTAAVGVAVKRLVSDEDS